MSGGHKMPEMKEGGVNVTPLIDVVMCLIVFFMLVARIGVATGASKAMLLPETIIGTKIEMLGDNLVLNVEDPTVERTGENGTAVLEPDGKPKKRSANDIAAAGLSSDQPSVSIFVKDDPTATAAEKARGGYKSVQIMRKTGSGNDFPLKTVVMAWKEAMEKQNADRKKRNEKPKEYSVTIRCERYVPFRLMQKVLGTLAECDIKNVNYAAIGKS